MYINWLLVSSNKFSRSHNSWGIKLGELKMDAVVIGTFASVVITVIVGAVIGYNVIKNMDNNSDDK